MKAIVSAAANHFAIKDVPKPELRPGCVLMRTEAVSLCLTEKRYFLGLLKADPNLILGHEVCAVVEAVADDVTDFKPGDRVIPAVGGKCGECLSCQTGLNNCERGFWDAGFLAEYTVKPARTLYKIPDSISSLAGAVVEPFASGYHAVRHSGLSLGDNVVIMGLQDYTWAIMQLLVKTPLTQIIAVDPLEERRALARELGIETVLDPTSCNVVEEVKKRMPHGADVTFVSMEEYIEPSQQYMTLAGSSTRIRGTIVNLMHFLQMPVVGAALWTKEINVKYFCGFGEEPVLGGKARSDYALTIDAMDKGVIKVDDLVPKYGKVYKFSELKTDDDVNAMFADMVTQNLKTFVSFE